MLKKEAEGPHGFNFEAATKLINGLCAKPDKEEFVEGLFSIFAASKQLIDNEVK